MWYLLYVYMMYGYGVLFTLAVCLVVRQCRITWGMVCLSVLLGTGEVLGGGWWPHWDDICSLEEDYELCVCVCVCVKVTVKYQQVFLPSFICNRQQSIETCYQAEQYAHICPCNTVGAGTCLKENIRWNSRNVTKCLIYQCFQHTFIL
jgi:hypothetical protein